MVNQQRPRQLRISNIRHGHRTRVECNDTDLHAQFVQLPIVLTQLRQMLATRQSP